MPNKLIIFIIILLSVVAAGVFTFYLNGLISQKPISTPTPIESPALDTWSDVPVDKSAPSADKCVIGGCSGQLCVEESEGDIITTCEYKAEYICYKTAKCERQNPPAGGGKCGWTPTEELVTCLGAAFQAEEN